MPMAPRRSQEDEHHVDSGYQREKGQQLSEAENGPHQNRDADDRRYKETPEELLPVFNGRVRHDSCCVSTACAAVTRALCERHE